MDFAKILNRYMSAVIKADPLVAAPDHSGVSGLEDDELAYLRELYRQLDKERQPGPFVTIHELVEQEARRFAAGFTLDEMHERLQEKYGENRSRPIHRLLLFNALQRLVHTSSLAVIGSTDGRPVRWYWNKKK